MLFYHTKLKIFVDEKEYLNQIQKLLKGEIKPKEYYIQTYNDDDPLIKDLKEMGLLDKLINKYEQLEIKGVRKNEKL